MIHYAKMIIMLSPILSSPEIPRPLQITSDIHLEQKESWSEKTNKQIDRIITNEDCYFDINDLLYKNLE